MGIAVDQACVSISDLKKNAHSLIKNIHTGSKIIFVNNKPVAIISSIQDKYMHIDEPFSFSFDPALDPKVVLDYFKLNG